jgi:hypothetical protein
MLRLDTAGGDLEAAIGIGRELRRVKATVLRV